MLGLLSTIVVTRLLLPHQLGLYAIAVTVSTFLLMLGGGVGLAGALIRRPAAPEHADLRAYVALQLGVTTILVGAVALATLPFGLVGQLTAVMVASRSHHCFPRCRRRRARTPAPLQANCDRRDRRDDRLLRLDHRDRGHRVGPVGTRHRNRRPLHRRNRLHRRTGADRRGLAALRSPAYPRDARDRRARTGSRLRGGAPRSDPRPGHGSCRKRLYCRLLGPRPSSAPSARDALVDAGARVLSSDGSNQVRRRGSRDACCHGSCLPRRSSPARCSRRWLVPRRHSCRSCSDTAGRPRPTLSRWRASRSSSTRRC